MLLALLLLLALLWSRLLWLLLLWLLLLLLPSGWQQVAVTDLATNPHHVPIPAVVTHGPCGIALWASTQHPFLRLLLLLWLLLLQQLLLHVLLLLLLLLLEWLHHGLLQLRWLLPNPRPPLVSLPRNPRRPPPPRRNRFLPLRRSRRLLRRPPHPNLLRRLVFLRRNLPPRLSGLGFRATACCCYCCRCCCYCCS